MTRNVSPKWALFQAFKSVLDNPQRSASILTMKPTHATSDMAYALSRLGPDRLAHSAYRMRSLLASPESIIRGKYPGPVLGSDFPVEPPNPFHGMYAAVTRLNPATGTSPNGEKGWYMEEALTVNQALWGFTTNAAYGWFKESLMGSIEVGKWADWVAVDRDILDDKSGKSLRDIQVVETWVGGRKVWPVINMAEVEREELRDKEQIIRKDEL
jgi:predicted amidohydrolase YtcJ